VGVAMGVMGVVYAVMGVVKPQSPWWQSMQWSVAVIGWY